MTFDDLLSGDAVFVDANILTYHCQPHPVLGPACTRLLQRIESQDLTGFSSTHVLAEVAHRLMTMEASVTFCWPFAGIGNRLRTNPNEVRRLSTFRVAVDALVLSKMHFLPVNAPLLARAAALSQSLGLLTNDALIVAVVQGNGLINVASHDADFDRVPGLTRFGPA
jgi:predicted nucleic acid-binding protein